MAKLPFGLYGDMRGKAGNNVGRRLRGENIVSVKPQPSEKPPTATQLEDRAKFGFTVQFLVGLASIIKVGFKGYTEKMSAMNAAVSYNYKNAVLGIAPNLTIDYPELSFSRGSLETPDNTSIAGMGDGKVTFRWDKGYEVDQDLNKGSDLVNFVVYNPSKHRFVQLRNVVPRSLGVYELQLPAAHTGDEVHGYISLIATDGRVSNTVHVGHVLVI